MEHRHRPHCGLRWTGSDAVERCRGVRRVGGQSVLRWRGEAGRRDHPTTYNLSGYNYDGDCGEGSAFDRAFWVVATDNRGNTASSNEVRPNVDVWQETVATSSAPPASPWPASVRGRPRAAPASTTTTLFSTAAGASLTYTVTSARPGQTVAIVVEKNNATAAPRTFSVDGGTATAVNTQASSPTHRVVAWTEALGVGAHTVRVTNAGTAGHSRVDVDAVMLTVGQGNASPPEPSSD